MYSLGMKMLPSLLCFFALLFVGCGKADLDESEKLEQILESAMEADKLQGRGKEGEELYYAPNSPKPYTGFAKQMYKNGQVSTLIKIKGGKWHGAAIMWYESGQKEAESNLKEGKMHGLMTVWYENGQKESESN